MAALFLDDFFLTALFRLFIAVTGFQMLFAVLVLWAFYSGISGVSKVDPWNGVKFDAFGIGFSAIGEAPENVTRPVGLGVSIIVCARNEAPNLRDNLPKILSQQYPGDWELIVVDDASTDDSKDVLQGFQRHHPRLRCLSMGDKKSPGKKQALATGIAAAKHGCILLSDADCAPISENWLLYMVSPMNINPKIEIVLGYGPMKRNKGAAFLEKWARFETAFTAMQYFSLAVIGIPYMGVGRNLALKKSVFERSGGFTAHQHILSGDDDLLVNAAANAENTGCCLHPDSFVYSDSKKSWATWAKQKKRHLGASPMYKWQHQLMLGMLSLSHSLHFFLLLFLLFFGFALQTTIYLSLLRSLLLFIVYRKVFSKLREPGLLSLFPIYDALLAVYYGALIPIFLIVKKTHSWN